MYTTTTQDAIRIAVESDTFYPLYVERALPVAKKKLPAGDWRAAKTEYDGDHRVVFWFVKA